MAGSHTRSYCWAQTSPSATHVGTAEAPETTATRTAVRCVPGWWFAIINVRCPYLVEHRRWLRDRRQSPSWKEPWRSQKPSRVRQTPPAVGSPSASSRAPSVLDVLGRWRVCVRRGDIILRNTKSHEKHAARIHGTPQKYQNIRAAHLTSGPHPISFFFIF